MKVYVGIDRGASCRLRSNAFVCLYKGLGSYVVSHCSIGLSWLGLPRALALHRGSNIGLAGTFPSHAALLHYNRSMGRTSALT